MKERKRSWKKVFQRNLLRFVAEQLHKWTSDCWDFLKQPFNELYWNSQNGLQKFSNSDVWFFTSLRGSYSWSRKTGWKIFPKGRRTNLLRLLSNSPGETMKLWKITRQSKIMPKATGKFDLTVSTNFLWHKKWNWKKERWMRNTWAWRTSFLVHITDNAVYWLRCPFPHKIMSILQ